MKINENRMKIHEKTKKHEQVGYFFCWTGKTATETVTPQRSNLSNHFIMILLYFDDDDNEL